MVSSTTPYGSLATMKHVVGEADVQRLAAAAQRQVAPGRGRRPPAAPMATLPSNSATVRRNASARSPPRAAACSAMTAGMTLASVVIGPAMRRPCVHLEVGVVVDVAVQRGHRVRRLGRRRTARLCSPFSGWQFGSLMMPTLAQRVWPSTDTRAVGRREREAQQVVGVHRGAQRLTLSPSSPISAAAL